MKGSETLGIGHKMVGNRQGTCGNDYKMIVMCLETLGDGQEMLRNMGNNKEILVSSHEMIFK